MQPFFKKITLVILALTTLVSCSKDKEETTGNIDTSPVTIVNYRSAKAGGVISVSKSAIIQRGVCFSTTSNPDITKTITKDGTGLGSYTSYISQLTANTKYFLRAYMVNAEGTTYGNEVEFTTPDYPTEGTWDLNENIYVVNDQNILTQFKWSAKDTSFLGGDNTTEANFIVVKFKQKPTLTKSYKLVNKSTDLADDECAIKVISARNPYVGTYQYTSTVAHPVQVIMANNKCRITIPAVDIFEVNDIGSTIPVSFNAVLVEK